MLPGFAAREHWVPFLVIAAHLWIVLDEEGLIPASGATPGEVPDTDPAVPPAVMPSAR
jgi:hypothetical protein